MHHSSTQRTRSGRVTAIAFVVALVAGVTVACAPPTPTEPSAREFCEFWDKVEETPPAADNAVLVKDEVVALADDTTVSGAECTDPGATVELDGAVLAEGEEVPSEQGNPDSEPIAAVTGDEIGSGAPVLENLEVRALSASIGANGITVRGNVAVRLSGSTSTIGFTGHLREPRQLVGRPVLQRLHHSRGHLLARHLLGHADGSQRRPHPLAERRSHLGQDRRRHGHRRRHQPRRLARHRRDRPRCRAASRSGPAPPTASSTSSSTTPARSCPPRPTSPHASSAPRPAARRST